MFQCFVGLGNPQALCPSIFSVPHIWAIVSLSTINCRLVLTDSWTLIQKICICEVVCHNQIVARLLYINFKTNLLGVAQLHCLSNQCGLPSGPTCCYYILLRVSFFLPANLYHVLQCAYLTTYIKWVKHVTLNKVLQQCVTPNGNPH